MNHPYRIALCLFATLIVSGCVSAPAPEQKEAQAAKKVETTIASSGPRTEKIVFGKATDDWHKGGITTVDGSVTVSNLMDKRVFTISAKIPVTPDLAYIELEVKSDKFEGTWGGKVCYFELNNQVLDPIGISTVVDPDGWRWVVGDMFEDGLLYVQLPVDTFKDKPDSVIKSISIFIGANDTGSLTFSGFNAVYK